jgi:hypothetical protein
VTGADVYFEHRSYHCATLYSPWFVTGINPFITWHPVPQLLAAAVFEMLIDRNIWILLDVHLEVIKILVFQQFHENIGPAMVQLASYRPCHWSIDQLSALPWAT